MCLYVCGQSPPLAVSCQREQLTVILSHLTVCVSVCGQSPPLTVSCQREQLAPILAMMYYSSKACRAIRRHYRAKVRRSGPPARSRLAEPGAGRARVSPLWLVLCSGTRIGMLVVCKVCLAVL